MNNYTDEEQKPEVPLFNISLNERGKVAIRSLRKIVITGFVTGIIYSVITLLLSVFYIVKVGVSLSPSAELIEIRSVSWPLLAILFDIFYFIQIFKLNNFSKNLHNAVLDNDEITFNESFSQLHTFVTIAIVSNILMTIIAVIDVYLLFEYVK